MSNGTLYSVSFGRVATETLEPALDKAIQALCVSRSPEFFTMREAVYFFVVRSEYEYSNSSEIDVSPERIDMDGRPTRSDRYRFSEQTPEKLRPRWWRSG